MPGPRDGFRFTDTDAWARTSSEYAPAGTPPARSRREGAAHACRPMPKTY
ncbi:hypothetical protein [Streptomyces sp. NPDC048252]